MLTRFATFEAVTEKDGELTGLSGELLPPDRTTADFILSVIPHSFIKAPPPPELTDPIVGATSFLNVTPGTRVLFQVRAYNDFVKSTSDAQIFRATIRVLAGGCTDLDAREVLILIPPTPLTGPW